MLHETETRAVGVAGRVVARGYDCLSPSKPEALLLLLPLIVLGYLIDIDVLPILHFHNDDALKIFCCSNGRIISLLRCCRAVFLRS